MTGSKESVGGEVPDPWDISGLAPAEPELINELGKKVDAVFVLGDFAVRRSVDLFVRKVDDSGDILAIEAIDQTLTKPGQDPERMYILEVSENCKQLGSFSFGLKGRVDYRFDPIAIKNLADDKELEANAPAHVNTILQGMFEASLDNNLRRRYLSEGRSVYGPEDFGAEEVQVQAEGVIDDVESAQKMAAIAAAELSTDEAKMRARVQEEETFTNLQSYLYVRARRETFPKPRNEVRKGDLDSTKFEYCDEELQFSWQVLPGSAPAVRILRPPSVRPPFTYLRHEILNNPFNSQSWETDAIDNSEDQISVINARLLGSKLDNLLRITGLTRE